MPRSSVSSLCLVAFATVPIGVTRAYEMEFDHLHVTVPHTYVILMMSGLATIEFHDQWSQPFIYTGDVTVTIAHTKGWEKFTRNDPYWDPGQQKVLNAANTFSRGASLFGDQGTTKTIHVQGQSSINVGYTIYSFGDTTLTATAGGKPPASDTVPESGQWIHGRATVYGDTDPERPDPPMCAIPWASGSGVSLKGTPVRIVNIQNQNVVTANISWPGPMVPCSPHYPTNDQNYNHYWGAAGWPPLAVALNGKIRARRTGEQDWGDLAFGSQIIDLPNYNNPSTTGQLGISGMEATVKWQFQ